MPYGRVRRRAVDYGGGGLLHEEIPRPRDARWRLPAWSTCRPTEDGHASATGVRSPQIPVADAGGRHPHLRSGRLGGRVQGPVTRIYPQPEYLDVRAAPRRALRGAGAGRAHAMAYVLPWPGALLVSAAISAIAANLDGQIVEAPAAVWSRRRRGGARDHPGKRARRFLLISARPLGEPDRALWSLVMNTEQELRGRGGRPCGRRTSFWRDDPAWGACSSDLHASTDPS